MASPFAVFRRNQKILLATVGIGAMIAFVFLDPLMRVVGRTRQQENPVVVETRYGDLKESDLQAMRASRELVDRFLQQVAAETIATQVRNNVLDSRYADVAMQRWYMNWRQILMDRSTASPEAAVVETLVLSKKAQQLGVVVSDPAINDFIKQVSDDSLTSETIEKIIGGLQGQGRGRVSPVRLFEAIRTEMLASKVAEMFARSLGDIPPAQRFDYYCRLNRRAKVELVPLAVSEFAAQVSDPSPAELQAFFDKYKDRFPDPASPEPGFKEPKRATFQYFKADFAKFKDEFEPQVTDAEIAEYYEKNKEQFRSVELPPEKTEPSDKPAEQPAPDDAPKAPEGSKPEDSKPEPPPSEPPKPKADTKDSKPDSAPEKPAGGKPANGDVPPEKSSDIRRPARIHLVSALQDEPTPAEPQAEAAADQLGKKPEPGDKPAVEAAPADEKPADKPGEQPPGKPEGDAAEKKDEAPAEAKPEPPKYEPLEKVRDQIRSSIAARKAGDRMGEIFDELMSEMRRYADEVDDYNARKGSDPKAVPPKPFPFAELAKPKGLEAKELPNVTAAEAEGEDLGKLQQRVRDPRSPIGMRAEPFVVFAFSDNFPTYRPDVLQDGEGNGYLFWKTDEAPAFVPVLDKVRDKVVRAWKMLKARDLARKRAAEYAAQAREGGKPFKEAFANQPNLVVTETDWFSWMTMGNVPFDQAGSRPRLSAVEGVQHVGESFMRDVFKLSQADIGVAANEPQDTVYVIRLAEYEKPIDEVRQDFASERRPLYLAVAIPDQRRIYDAWLKDVEKDAGVHWLREADTARRSHPVDEEPEGDLDY